MSCFDTIALSCTIYTMSCTFGIYAIYPLTFMVINIVGCKCLMQLKIWVARPIIKHSFFS